MLCTAGQGWHVGSFVLHYLNFRCAASPCIPVRQGTVSLVMSAYNSMYMAWSCKHAGTLCIVALFKIQMGQIMHTAHLAAFRPKSANDQPGHVQNAILLRYFLWHDRGTNQDLVHKLEPQRKGVQSSLPLPSPHCPLHLLLPKGKMAPKAKICLL